MRLIEIEQKIGRAFTICLLKLCLDCSFSRENPCNLVVLKRSYTIPFSFFSDSRNSKKKNWLM
ncbi:hypothetical protein C5S53_00565 [Methanophagales archaeon]|nr:hypothetical protein C5S53_00565 [Methanophagales archaeon]